MPGAFGFGFGDPAGDAGRVCAGVQGGPVLGELAVAVGDLGVDPGVPWVGLVLDGGGGEFVYGAAKVTGPELAGQPAVQRPE